MKQFINGKKVLKELYKEKHEIMEMIANGILTPYSPASREPFTFMVGFRLLRKLNEAPRAPLAKGILCDHSELYPVIDEVLFDRDEVEILKRETSKDSSREMLRRNILLYADLIKEGINKRNLPMPKVPEVCDALQKILFKRNFGMWSKRTISRHIEGLGFEGGKAGNKKKDAKSNNREILNDILSQSLYK